MLLCCVGGISFTYLCDLKEDAENPATYAAVKAAFQTKFCCDEFKQMLMLKLQNLRFTREKPITSFLDELYTTIKDLYEIDVNTLTNHMVNNLDPMM